VLTVETGGSEAEQPEADDRQPKEEAQHGRTKSADAESCDQQRNAHDCKWKPNISDGDVAEGEADQGEQNIAPCIPRDAKRCTASRLYKIIGGANKHAPSAWEHHHCIVA
jgi:hypothetical protein